MGWLFVMFGAMHLVLGLGLFGFLAWLMAEKGGDDVEDAGGGDGGSRLRPRPWRPGPGRSRPHRGPTRTADGTRDRDRGPAVRPARQPG